MNSFLEKPLSLEEWEKSGMLVGLEKQDQEELIVFLNKAIEAYSKLYKEGKIKSFSTVEMLVIPSTRRVFSLFKASVSRFSSAKYLAKFEPEELVNCINDNSELLIAVYKKVFPSLDAEAEACSLIAQGYGSIIRNKLILETK